MSQANVTIGHSIGKLIGNTAAYAVHGAARTAQYAGHFGQDVAAGATEQYVVKNAELEAKRAEFRAARGAIDFDAVPPAAVKQRKVGVKSA
jgi:hypothetical protein